MPRRKRRTYTDEYRQRIVAESRTPGASPRQIADREGINPSLIFNWRRQLPARRQAKNGHGDLWVLTFAASEGGVSEQKFTTKDKALDAFVAATTAGASDVRLWRSQPVEIVVQARLKDGDA